MLTETCQQAAIIDCNFNYKIVVPRARIRYSSPGVRLVVPCDDIRGSRDIYNLGTVPPGRKQPAAVSMSTLCSDKY